jgi:hypothetical protein
MRKRWLWLGVPVALAVWVWPSQAQDSLDSLVVCKDTQKLLFENSFVRVIDDVMAPGVKEPKHWHPHGLVIALVDVDADTETTVLPAGQVVRGHSKAGAVTWGEVTVHETRNPGTSTSHFIGWR